MLALSHRHRHTCIQKLLTLFIDLFSMWLWEPEAAGCKWFRTFCKSLSSFKPRITGWYANQRQTHYPESGASTNSGSFSLSNIDDGSFLIFFPPYRTHTDIIITFTHYIYTELQSSDCNALVSASWALQLFGHSTIQKQIRKRLDRGPLMVEKGLWKLLVHLFVYPNISPLPESCSFPSRLSNHLSIFKSLHSDARLAPCGEALSVSHSRGRSIDLLACR